MARMTPKPAMMDSGQSALVPCKVAKTMAVITASPMAVPMRCPVCRTAPDDPAYGVLRPVTESASVLLCDNPGIMTLDGTNTWVLMAPGGTEAIVIDPGEDEAARHPQEHA